MTDKKSLEQVRAEAADKALTARNVNLDALKTLEEGEQMSPVNKQHCAAAVTEYGVAAGEVGKDILSHAQVNLDPLKGTMEKTTELYEQKCVVKPKPETPAPPK